MNIKTRTAGLLFWGCLALAAQTQPTLTVVPEPGFNPQLAAQMQDFVNNVILPYAPSIQLLPPTTSITMVPSLDDYAHGQCVPVYAIGFPSNPPTDSNLYDGNMWAFAHEFEEMMPCNQNISSPSPYEAVLGETLAQAQVNSLFTLASRNIPGFLLQTNIYTAWTSQNLPWESAGGEWDKHNGSETQDAWYNQQDQQSLGGILEMLSHGNYINMDQQLVAQYQPGGPLNITQTYVPPIGAYFGFFDSVFPTLNGRTATEIFWDSPQVHFDGPDGTFLQFDFVYDASSDILAMSGITGLQLINYGNTYVIPSPVINSYGPLVVPWQKTRQGGQTTLVAGAPVFIKATDWNGNSLWSKDAVTGDYAIVFPDMSGYDFGLYQLTACLEDVAGSGNCDPQYLPVIRHLVSLQGYPNWPQGWYWVLGNGPDTFSQLSASLNLQVTGGDPQVTATTFQHGILGIQFNGSTNPVTVSDGTRSMTLDPIGDASPFIEWTPLDQPVINAGGVVNAASFTAEALAPGGIYSAFGLGLAHRNASANSTPLPTILDRTQVVITSGGKDYNCPLYYVSGLQANFQVPYEVPAGAASVKDVLGVTPSSPISVTIGQADPAIFQVGNGLGAVVHNRGYSLVTPSSPAKVGEYVDIFGTGLGSVNPPVPTGQAAPNSPLSATMATAVNLGAQTVQPYWCGLAPGYVGLYQCTVQIPENAASGQANLSLTIAGIESNSVTLPIQ